MLSPFLHLLFITLVPWIELRGAIPYGIGIGLNPVAVFLFCVCVNVLLLFPLFFFLDYFFPFIRHWQFIDRTVSRVHRKSSDYVRKWGFIGLALFVAIPLPGSGAYSGALAAYILGVPRPKAFVAISLGVILAGVMVTVASWLARSTLL